MIMLGTNEAGEAHLKNGYCSRCGVPASEVRWKELREAKLRCLSLASKRARFSLGVRSVDVSSLVSRPEAPIYCDPAEEALNFLVSEGEERSVNVEARCVPCDHTWPAWVVGVLGSDPTTDEAKNSRAADALLESLGASAAGIQSGCTPERIQEFIAFLRACGGFEIH